MSDDVPKIDLDAWEDKLRQHKHATEDELRKLKDELSKQVAEAGDMTKKQMDEAKGVIEEFRKFISEARDKEKREEEAKVSKTSMVVPPADTKIEQDAAKTETPQTAPTIAGQGRKRRFWDFW